MQKKLEPVLRFFRRLVKNLRSSCQTGRLSRFGAAAVRGKERAMRFFMGLWKNWSTVRRAGMLHLLVTYARIGKEFAFRSFRELIPDKGSAQRTSLMKRSAALSLMILITVSSVVTVMAATHDATVVCDGVAKTVEMTSPETDKILLKAGVSVGPDDLVSRSGGPDDTVVTVRTARHVEIGADDAEKTVTVHYGDTVQQALQNSGIVLGAEDLVTPSANSAVEDGDQITVTRMVPITVLADGKSVSAAVTKGSVREALQQAGIPMDGDDTMNAAPDAEVTPGMKIVVSRVSYADETQTRPVAFRSVTKTDSSLPAGTTKVRTAGQNGSKTVVVRHKTVDGKLVETKDISTTVTQQPVDQVTVVGTKRSAVKSVGSGGTLTDKNGNALSYQRVLTGRCSCYTGGGWTSTGKKAAFGLVAVNPHVIPYGTRLYIASPDGKVVYGYAIAADTGGAAMRGSIIADLYFDSYSQCMRIGTRTMNVYIL